MATLQAGPEAALPDVSLQVKTRDESRGVGRISKQWSGLLKEVFTDTDNFGIQFPMDLDVKVKAVLLGACFLIVSPAAAWDQPQAGAWALASGRCAFLAAQPPRT